MTNIKQEFTEESGTLQHRLVNTETGEMTQWAGYTSFTYLNGFVGHTAFFGTVEAVCTPDAFCKLAAVG